MELTAEQTRAVYEDKKNILVSAGAGSGKTSVLTTRVIRKLKDHVNIDELLILTFTNAAALEMKERIRKRIKKEPELKNQLDYLDSAHIGTFDSFASTVVKKYNYLLNISLRPLATSMPPPQTKSVRLNSQPISDMLPRLKPN